MMWLRYGIIIGCAGLKFSTPRRSLESSNAISILRKLLRCRAHRYTLIPRHRSILSLGGYSEDMRDGNDTNVKQRG